ncbi:ThiF family adenylyltransferase [Dactylosporangium sp. NPDC050588]|uniref:ThiF family adenylyltransferase n=1 Tax=Dactylosporangium sp. NPDC050588 TaxID=3157211 RepID=UPI0034014FFA
MPGERTARQALIPGWDQARIHGTTAVIVGLGALGNEVAKNLALLGVGRLVLCDPDVVSSSNLSRTVLFTGDDVGRPKVEAAAAAVRRIAPGIVVDPRRADLVRGVGIGELADAGVVLGCLDSRRARLQLLSRCVLGGARLVDGGTHPWGGEVRVRVDPAEGCYSCSLPAGQRASTDDPVSCAAAAERPQPSSILSTALVAAWMTVAAGRLLLGERLPWRLLSVDGLTGTTGNTAVTRDPACPHHRPATPVELLPVDVTATVGQLLAVLPAGVEPVTWVLFGLPGFCYDCSRTVAAGVPAGRGVVPCPSCGQPVRMRLTQRIRDALPDVRLSELDVAPGEILPVLEGGDTRWFRLAPNPTSF